MALILATIALNRELVYRATDSESHVPGGCLVRGGLGQLLYNCSISSRYQKVDVVIFCAFGWVHSLYYNLLPVQVRNSYRSKKSRTSFGGGTGSGMLLTSNGIFAKGRSLAIPMGRNSGENSRSVTIQSRSFFIFRTVFYDNPNKTLIS